jgi:hypothetical protein
MDSIGLFKGCGCMSLRTVAVLQEDEWMVWLLVFHGPWIGKLFQVDGLMELNDFNGVEDVLRVFEKSRLSQV